MAESEWLDSTVSLPPGLQTSAIRRSIEYVEQNLTELVEIYYEQMNVFSALVSIYGTKALDALSDYEKHRNIDTAQQRFPDLRRRGSGTSPSPGESLESKGSKRPWAVQSHYDHPGWYIIWRYLIDPTKSLESDKEVVIWRVDVAYLSQSDWKYESSRAGPQRGGRTHTFGLRSPASRLRGMAVYARPDVILAHGKPVPSNGEP